MLRLVHTQKVQGAILVDDIDDGLPNKQVHRLGSSGDPRAYARDGYANAPKQPVYIPRVTRGHEGLPGYIDLRETQCVILSAAKGKIAGLKKAGLIAVTSLVEADLVAPTVLSASFSVGPGLAISGTRFLSIEPEVSSVVITGAGAVTLTRAQIISGGGAFTDTSIAIPSALVPGAVAATSSVSVRANAKPSSRVAIS